MTDEKPILIYTDGASRGNPGLAAAAFIILKNDVILYEESFYLGRKQTNNQAEYQAIIKALDKAKKYANNKIIIHSDSELVIKQINGDYRVNKPHLQILRSKVNALEKKFSDIKYIHVSRNNAWIKYVDRLCNQNLNKNS